MKIARVSIAGFRGYLEPVHLDFAPGFNVIDGRNGVGKSTIFDAIEFALTGDLSKYAGATAAGQSVADYIWWLGDGDPPAERYVEVKFEGDRGAFTIRRTPLDGRNYAVDPNLVDALATAGLAPDAPLKQLCATTIIRDEHIAGLSLDLKETERYALLRQAIGATDAETWIGRAQTLLAQAKRRREAAQAEVSTLNGELASASRRLDDLRASLASDEALAEATDRLRAFVGDPKAPPESLSGLVRRRLAATEQDIQALRTLNDLVPEYNAAQQGVGPLRTQLASAQVEFGLAASNLADLSTAGDQRSSSGFATRARTLMGLILEGRRIGLVEDHCPLCSADHTEESFHRGTEAAEDVARRMDELAAELAIREEEIAAAQRELAQHQGSVNSITNELGRLERIAATFTERASGLLPREEWTAPSIKRRISELGAELEAAQRDLRVLDTLRLNEELARATETEVAARDHLQRAQERYGRARKGEAAAAALYDAARRAASETLDLRIDRVLPLMAELYSRLKPHPVWQDIHYSIRGDLKRFLTLRVGDDLNPQFLFSSGQRRATGLAFLLSINLSLAWSHWQSVLLDDPVQHVDDFRTVHLAEVLAQLVTAGRQIICAVEDPALADMMCRRLPVRETGQAQRLTLGISGRGTLHLQRAEWLKPLPLRAFRSGEKEMAS